jgi:hypothetical protein
LNFSAGMASTAATVFFCRPGRMSRRAELTGSFVDAGVVCAAAEAASNSKAGITRVVFILSSIVFGESGGLPQPQFPGHQPSRLYNHSNACQYSISFASSPLGGPVGHSVIPTPIRSWRCSCSRNICREEPLFAGKVTSGVRNETSGQSWPSNTVATDPFTGQNRNSVWQRYPAQTSGGWRPKTLYLAFQTLRYIGMAARGVLSSLPFSPINLDKGPSAAAMVVELPGFASNCPDCRLANLDR